MAKAKKKAPKKTAVTKAAEASKPPEKAEPTPGGGLLAPWSDIDRLFDDFIERRWGRPFGMKWPTLRGFEEEMARVASVDIIDGDKEITVRAEVPGIDKKDLDVSITDRTLTIKGSTRTEEKKEEGDYYRREIRSGSVSRSVLLPADVDAAKAKASFKDGIVELKLPKLRESKRRKISVS